MHGAIVSRDWYVFGTRLYYGSRGMYMHSMCGFGWNGSLLFVSFYLLL